MSADGEAVRAWFLRNGAQAHVLTAGGALIGGDATNGIDVDVTRLPALPAGTNNIGDVDVLTFPDNEPFNVAQINGVTPLMGNGAVGTGALRVTIASDSTGNIGVAQGSTTTGQLGPLMQATTSAFPPSTRPVPDTAGPGPKHPERSLPEEMTVMPPPAGKGSGLFSDVRQATT